MTRRSRAAVWLVFLAAVMTLGHLIGPHSHSIAQAADPETPELCAADDCGDEPHHQEHQPEGHHSVECGLLMPPSTDDTIPTDSLEAPAAEATAVTPPSLRALGPGGRSPPRLVAELQVNRV